MKKTNFYGKVCTTCNTTKRNIKDRKCFHCKQVRQNRWLSKEGNRERAAASKKRWGNKNKEKLRDMYYRGRYNVSLDDYNKLYKKQKGKCWICNKFQKTLYVDHNHKTKIVRALLCNNCNFMIGHSHENIAILKMAIIYLIKFIKEKHG